jgi:F420H(2)-dependent quinone reductase
MGKRSIKLVTTGRRTGKPRQVTLYGVPDGDGLVIVGSAGGSPTHPAWVHNLRAHPDVRIRDGGETRDVRAREVAEADRERLWELVSAAFPLYRQYQRRTDRLIPLFVLEPAG